MEVVVKNPSVIALVASFLVIASCNSPNNSNDDINTNVTTGDLLGYWIPLYNSETDYDSSGHVLNVDKYTLYDANKNDSIRTLMFYTIDSAYEYEWPETYTYWTCYREKYSIYHGYYIDGDTTFAGFVDYFNEYAGKDDDAANVEIINGKTLHIYYKENNVLVENYLEKYNSDQLPAYWPNKE
jgi:hypothetical protein